MQRIIRKTTLVVMVVVLGFLPETTLVDLPGLPAVRLPGILSAQATDFNWVSSTNGAWNFQNNWFPLTGPPMDGDNAFHETTQSRIEVDRNEQCENFTGDGDSPKDRFLLIERGWLLTVDADLKKASGSGNFAVKLENGLPEVSTRLTVKGIDEFNRDNLEGIDLGPAPGGFGENANWVTVDIDGYVKNSSFTLGDNVRVYIGSPVEDPIAKVSGPGNWSFGDKGVVEVWGEIYNDLNMTVRRTTPGSGV